jgi:hypothetical protein
MLGQQWWDSQPGCSPTIRDRNIGKNRRRPPITLGEDVSGTGWSSTVQRFTQAGLPMRLPVAAIAPAEAGCPMLASRHRLARRYCARFVSPRQTNRPLQLPFDRSRHDSVGPQQRASS